MKEFAYRLAGEECRVYFPESSADVTRFLQWAESGHRYLALDTETTGLGIFGPAFRTRLVQFGTRTEAWVLDARRWGDAIRRVLRDPAQRFVIHNAAYDGLVLDRCDFVDLDDLLSRVMDTRILAHLCDPRGREEGGTGLGLKDLSSVYVDASAPDTSKGLFEVFRKEYGADKATGWAVIDLDHPTYLLYAGLDVLLTARLFDVLGPQVKERGFSRLATFEHEVQGVTARMMRRGVLLDVPYTTTLVERLQGEAAQWQEVAARFGVENVNSTAQIAEALEGMGETLTEKTPSGAWKVDKEVLLSLADLDRDLERIGAREKPNPLAEAVFHSKRAGKWSKTYAEAMLLGRDGDDRVHPSISALQARTARMSISQPPLQQLPSGDWTIRRCLVADPGKEIGGVDFQAVELRVLAAVADVANMKKAIAEGQDLHGFTAELIYGADWTDFHRKMTKAVGLGKVYGGGAATLSRQTGAPLGQVKKAVAEYDRVYPEVKRYGKRLQRSAEFGAREVITPSGRVLPLDRDRLYAATNYVVQSTARDLFAQALLDLEEAGLGEYLLLPVHDEVIFQAPKEDAADVAQAIARAMESDFFGVPIGADPDVYGATWGHGYACKVKKGSALCTTEGDHPHKTGVAHS